MTWLATEPQPHDKRVSHGGGCCRSCCHFCDYFSCFFLCVSVYYYFSCFSCLFLLVLVCSCLPCYFLVFLFVTVLYLFFLVLSCAFLCVLVFYCGCSPHIGAKLNMREVALPSLIEAVEAGSFVFPTLFAVDVRARVDMVVCALLFGTVVGCDRNGSQCSTKRLHN